MKRESVLECGREATALGGNAAGHRCRVEDAAAYRCRVEDAAGYCCRVEDAAGYLCTKSLR